MRWGCNPKLLVNVAAGLNLAHRKRGAPAFSPLAFETSSARALVGGASARCGRGLCAEWAGPLRPASPTSPRTRGRACPPKFRRMRDGWSRGRDAPPTKRGPPARGARRPAHNSSPAAALGRRATYDLPWHLPATVALKAPNGALDISHGCKPVDQGHPAITRSPQGD